MMMTTDNLFESLVVAGNKAAAAEKAVKIIIIRSNVRRDWITVSNGFVG